MKEKMQQRKTWRRAVSDKRVVVREEETQRG
jgi:hypothetical protein